MKSLSDSKNKNLKIDNVISGKDAQRNKRNLPHTKQRKQKPGRVLYYNVTSSKTTVKCVKIRINYHKQRKMAKLSMIFNILVK